MDSYSDQRKRKRMMSNRESAKRSRIRKQKKLDELVAQVSQLSREKKHILGDINVATQVYLNVDADNSVLRAQLAELTQRLHSLNEIIDVFGVVGDDSVMSSDGDDWLNTCNITFRVDQPIMASANKFMMQ